MGTEIACAANLGLLIDILGLPTRTRASHDGARYYQVIPRSCRLSSRVLPHLVVTLHARFTFTEVGRRIGGLRRPIPTKSNCYRLHFGITRWYSLHGAVAVTFPQLTPATGWVSWVTLPPRRLPNMSRRKAHLRISEREKAILDSTKSAVFGDDDVPYGVVIERACRSLLAEDCDDGGGISF